METFYFGRLNYKSEYNLSELLTYGNKYRTNKKNIQFGIFSVEEIEDPVFGKIFTGELVKYQDLKEEPVIKEDKLSTEYIKDVILGKSRFFLLEKTHLIAYNPYGNIITQKIFCDAFTGVIIGADDTFDVDSVIYPVNYEYEFMSFLKSMRTVNKITIKLTPSNPNNRDIWKDIDERLNQLHIGHYKEEMTAMNNESIFLDEIIESKIHMAQDGYGKAFGEGRDEDGNDVTISTESSESVMRKAIGKDLPVRQQLFEIKSVFKTIIERFKR